MKFIFRALCATTLAITPRVVAGSPAYAYTVQGQLELKSLRWSTNDGSFYYQLQTNGFELQSKDCRWWVKLGTHDPEVYDYRIVSSDGASTYLLLSYETRQKLALRAGKTPPRNMAGGHVARGNLPRFSFANEAGAAWIAYASWCHFAEDSHSRRREVPFANYVSPAPITSGDPLAIENAFWRLTDSPPRLPKTLLYYTEEAANQDDLQSTNRFTNVVYQARSFMDLEDLRLPKESLTSIYRRRTRPSNTVTQLCLEMRLLATNAFLGAELESFKPKLPGDTAIFEERFDNPPAVNFAYFSDDHWVSEPLARTSEALEEARLSLGGGDEKFLPRGTSAPEISLRSLSGTKEAKISDYRGKVTVLEFWATWCGPCQTAMDELQSYVQKYPAWQTKVALITASVDQDWERAAQHVQRKGWNKTENFWTTKEACKAYQFSGIPMVYILDQRGKIAASGHRLNIAETVNTLLRAP